MLHERADLTADFAGYCASLLEESAAICGDDAPCYRAGRVRFVLSEREGIETAWADAQFPRVSPLGDEPRVYLSYAPLSASPMLRMLHRLGFADVESLFAEIGCTGFYDAETGRLEFYDPVRRAGLRVLPHTDAFPAWESTAPLANFVSWINAEAGGVMLHAATLATAKRGALICGRGGSGKSLLTLAGVLSEMDSVGDDYVVVGREGGGYAATQCALTAKQTPAGLTMLGAAGEAFRTGPLNWQSKHVFALPPRSSDAPLPVDMVILPRIGKQPRLAEARRTLVFRHLTESTLYQLAANSAAVVSLCGDILRTCPSYDFEMGPDIAANAAYLRGVLDGEISI